MRSGGGGCLTAVTHSNRADETDEQGNVQQKSDNSMALISAAAAYLLQLLQRQLTHHN